MPAVTAQQLSAPSAAGLVQVYNKMIRKLLAGVTLLLFSRSSLAQLSYFSGGYGYYITPRYGSYGVTVPAPPGADLPAPPSDDSPPLDGPIYDPCQYGRVWGCPVT